MIVCISIVLAVIAGYFAGWLTFGHTYWYVETWLNDEGDWQINFVGPNPQNIHNFTSITFKVRKIDNPYNEIEEKEDAKNV